MANFYNKIDSVGQLYQAENMTFGGTPSSADDLRRQIANLTTLLAKAGDVPETTRTLATKALTEVAAVPFDAPDAKRRITGGLEGARRILEEATGIAKQAAPLIGAISAVVAAVSGFMG